MGEYEQYGPGQPMNAADVAAIIAERDRLRAVVDADPLWRPVLAVLANIDAAPQDPFELSVSPAVTAGVVKLLDSIIAERNRLRRVVAVATEFVIAFDTQMDYTAELNALRSTLMTLDESAEATDG